MKKIVYLGALAFSGSRYGWGSGPAYMDHVQCSGSEDTLLECSRGSHIGDVGSVCKTHAIDASVYCPIGKPIALALFPIPPPPIYVECMCRGLKIRLYSLT